MQENITHRIIMKLQSTDESHEMSLHKTPRQAVEIDGVILGAFGCGVFAQNPTRVAQLFKESPIPAKLKVVFAIPGGKNYTDFAKVFG